MHDLELAPEKLYASFMKNGAKPHYIDRDNMDKFTETVTVTLTKYQWERVEHALFCYKVDALLEDAMASYKTYGEVLEAVETQLNTATVTVSFAELVERNR